MLSKGNSGFLKQSFVGMTKILSGQQIVVGRKTTECILVLNQVIFWYFNRLWFWITYTWGKEWEMWGSDTDIWWVISS